MPRSAVAHGLSTTDLTLIRDGLAAGRKPKVVFTAAAGQIAGQVGQVVALTDAAASDEWIIVRFGRDELPFAPTDLQPATRANGATGANGATRANGAVKADRPPGSGGATRLPTPRTATAVTPATPPPAPAPPSGAASRPAAPAAEQPRTSRSARSKPPASLTVTLAYADREWTVAAHQGQKTVAKPSVVKPTDALRMVAMIDAAAVHDAVQSIIAAERAEAEGRAGRLRAELAEVEARLAELGRNG